MFERRAAGRPPYLSEEEHRARRDLVVGRCLVDDERPAAIAEDNAIRPRQRRILIDLLLLLVRELAREDIRRLSRVARRLLPLTLGEIDATSRLGSRARSLVRTARIPHDVNGLAQVREHRQEMNALDIRLIRKRLVIKRLEIRQIKNDIRDASSREDSIPHCSKRPRKIHVLQTTGILTKTLAD